MNFDEDILNDLRTHRPVASATGQISERSWKLVTDKTPICWYDPKPIDTNKCPVSYQTVYDVDNLCQTVNSTSQPITDQIDQNRVNAEKRLSRKNMENSNLRFTKTDNLIENNKFTEKLEIHQSSSKSKQQKIIIPKLDLTEFENFEEIPVCKNSENRAANYLTQLSSTEKKSSPVLDASKVNFLHPLSFNKNEDVSCQDSSSNEKLMTFPFRHLQPLSISELAHTSKLIDVPLDCVSEEPASALLMKDDSKKIKKNKEVLTNLKNLRKFEKSKRKLPIKPIHNDKYDNEKITENLETVDKPISNPKTSSENETAADVVIANLPTSQNIQSDCEHQLLTSSMICESNWLRLPEEIYVRIFRLLPDLNTKLQLALVCKRFCHVLRSRHCWPDLVLDSSHAASQLLTDQTLGQMAQRMRLESVTLDRCNGQNLTESGLFQFFSKCGPTLTRLTLSNCQAFPTEYFWLSAARFCPNLLCIDASFSYPQLSNQTVSKLLDKTNIRQHASSQCFGHLQKIKLNCAVSLDNLTFLSFLPCHSSSLTVLELYGCNNIQFDQLHHISSCLKLKQLSLGAIHRLDAVELIKTLRKLESLECLDLHLMSQLVDDQFLGDLFQPCFKRPQTSTFGMKLSQLNLSHNTLVTDQGVEHVCSCIGTALTSLVLRGCNRVGNSAVFAIARNCPNMSNLDLSNSSVDSHGIKYVCWHSIRNSLVSLHMNFLLQIRVECLQELSNSCPNLKQIFVYGNPNLSKWRSETVHVCTET